MKNKIFFFIAVLLLLLISLGIYLTRSVLIFEVRDQRKGRNILQLVFKPRDVFSLQTIHSVAKTPYSHIFKIDTEGNIVLSEAVFESGGGGFPVTGDGEYSFVDGKFRMSEINRFVGILRFRVSPVSRETLLVSNAEVPLYKLVPEGTLIQIKVSKAWVWPFLNSL